MDAKTKAQELIEKYTISIAILCNINNDPSITTGLLIKESAIKLALIAVNEIIKANPSHIYWNMNDYETHSSITFWNEVKLELEALN